MNEALFDACTSKRLAIAHVAEVGVYLPDTSNVLGFIRQGVRADLFEADPECIALIGEYFRDRTNVTLHPYAIVDEARMVTFCRTGASTFAEELRATPALMNDGYRPKAEDRFVAEGRRFDEFDDGTIDLLSLDVEGGEWFVLKHLRSRPSVISLETHFRHYRNPFMAEIRAWMSAHGYRVWYRDRSDTVFYRADVLDLEFFENLRALSYGWQFERSAAAKGHSRPREES